VVGFGRGSDDPERGLRPDDPTVIRTVLIIGVLAGGSWWETGDFVLVGFGPSELPGLLPRVEDESELRRL
jgi:hypothetical protein